MTELRDIPAPRLGALTAVRPIGIDGDCLTVVPLDEATP